MGLTFFKGDSQQSCYKGGINHLKPFLNQIDVPVYVVVPDRASLVSEMDLIENLGTAGILNFDVITINKLVRMVLPDIDASTVGRTGMLVKIKQIINQNLNNFKIYKKLAAQNSKGFVDEIYETILQFKASNITPAAIENGIKKMPELLALKMSDILLIYKAYEEFLTDEIFDGSSKLNSVITNIKFCEKIPHAIFWFAKSEALTNQAVEIVNELVKYAKDVYVSLPQTKLTNFYSGFEYTLTENAKINFKKVSTVNVVGDLTETQTYVKNNLFKFTAQPQKQNAVKLIETKNDEDEIKFIAAEIVKRVKSGECKFCDFNVAASNLANKEDLIKSVFDDFEIPYNIDSETLAKDNVVTKFIFGAFEVLKSHFKCDKVLAFAKNGLNFLELSDLCDFENYVYKYGIEGGDFSRTFFAPGAERVRAYVFNLLEPLYNEFVKSEMGEDFAFVMLDFLELSELNARVDRMLELLNAKEAFVDANVTKLCFDKIVKIFDQIKIVINKDSFSVNNFFDVLSLAINELRFNIAPVLSNAVFVGDAFDSYFGERKFLFILGACEKDFPRVKNDVGVISDDEILNLNLAAQLSPSVSEVNARYLQRAYELLYFAKNTFISFPAVCGGETMRPSFFYLTLKKLLSEAFERVDNVELVNFKQAYNYALMEYNKASRGLVPDEPEVASSLINLFKIGEGERENKPFDANKNYLGLAFNDNTISVSQLETYATCPYKHYLKYVLKLKPQEKSEIGSLDVGNVIHRFVELFLKHLDVKKAQANLREYSKNLMQNVLNEKQFEDVLKNKLNAPIINGLLKESEKIAETLFAHLTNSNFKPIKFEHKFGADSNVKINGISLVGKVDRIDKCESESLSATNNGENEVRIIDYKTGSSTSFNYSDIYYGTAIQLPIYSYILNNGNNKVVGMFYLVIRNKFNGKEIPRLNGVTLNDLCVIKNMDLNLEPGARSSLLEIRLTNDGVVDGKNKNSVVSVSEINALFESAVNLASSVIDEIREGNMNPSILTGGLKACDFCDYKNLSACKNCMVRKKRTISKDEFYARLKEGESEL